MSKTNTSAVLRCQRINKWIGARRGRVTLLAQMQGKKREELYKLISENRLSAELLLAIERAQIEVEEMEKECIKRFPSFKRFVKKGDGRVPRLAEKMETSIHNIRDLAHAKGDGRYLMIKYGVDKIMNAIRDCERDSRQSSYNTEKINVRIFVEKHIQNKQFTFEELLIVADEVRQNADIGNHDGALICRQMGDKFKVISIGFDMAFSNMGKSHVCDPLNPHVHAPMFAALNVPKQNPKSTGDLVLFSHHAPCGNCADRLLSVGVQRAYCLYEPELMEGLKQLALNFIPVIKYSILEKTFITMNGVAYKAA